MMEILFDKGYIVPRGIVFRSIKGKRSLASVIVALYCCEQLIRKRGLKGNWWIKFFERAEIFKCCNYFVALEYLMKGRYREAYFYIKKYEVEYDDNPEGAYIESECLKNIGTKEEAFNCLSRFVEHEKTWIKLADLVENKDDYFHFIKLYQNYLNINNGISANKRVQKELIKACLRSKNYSIAEHYIKNIGKMNGQLNKKLKISKKQAKIALQDLIEAFDMYNIPLFVISGTLLGILREDNFLGHDTDLDTGVFDNIDINKMIEVVQKKGCFLVLPNRTKSCLRVKHINGTPIDIFIHYRTTNDYFHEGVKVRWHNSPFTLKAINFNGITVHIPNDPTKYLVENYGRDWNVPKIDFDSSIDCPNSTIINKAEFEISQKMKLMFE